MKTVIKKPKFSILEVLFASYLVNVFYISSVMEVSRRFTWGIALLYIILNINRLIRIVYRSKKFISIYSILFFIWLFLIAITPTIHKTGDYTYFGSISTIIGTAINLIVVMLIAEKSKNNMRLSESFMKLYMDTIVLYIIFTTLCILFPSIKNIVLRTVYISHGNMNLISLRKYATRIGWAGFSGYSVSLKCSIANIFALFFIIKKHFNGEKQEIKCFFMYIITFLGGFYYSRTGLIVSLLILCLAFIFTLQVRNILNSIWAALFIAIIVVSIPTLQTLALTNRSLAWIFEPFLNLLSDDGFTTTSSTHILNNMIFKLTSSQLIWGDGMYTGYSGYYMKTDLGFMRLILYFGALGLIFTYSLIWMSLQNLRKNTLSNIRSWYCVSILCTFVVFEFKGESILFLIPMLFILSMISTYDINTISQE